MILCILQNIKEPLRQEIGYEASSEYCLPFVISAVLFVCFAFRKELEDYFSMEAYDIR